MKKLDMLVVVLVSITGTIVAYNGPNIKKSHAIVKTKLAIHSRVKRALPASTYTQAQKDETVTKHNEFRTATPASNMQYMCWDENLASMAQEWANRCTWRHGNPTENISPWSDLGQNLFWSSGSPSSPVTAVISWHNEISDYTYEGNSCSDTCGHYTQVVWATTTHVGCGIKACTPADGGDKTSGTIIVCNYGPPGNYQGALPYQKGNACSACANNEASCKNEMCAESTQPCDSAGGGGGGEEDVCEGVSCQNGGTPTASGSTCKCKCTSEWQGDDCSENVEQATFGIKVNVRMSLDDWDDAWNAVRPLVADAITTICNTNTWYTTCCQASSPNGVSFVPELDYMTENDVKLGTGFPQESSPLVTALLYAQAQDNNDLCNAGAEGRRKRDAQDFLPQNLVLAAVEGKRSEINTALQDCCEAGVESVVKAEVYDDNSALYPVASMTLMTLCVAAHLIP